MKTTTILIGAWLAAGAPETINFDKGDVGKPPSGWTATQTGSGQAKWAIVEDDTAPSKPNVLKQSGQATYPVCLKDDTSLKDGFVEVKFKALSGKEDQAGGVVWRAKDANNYYVARANALENNVTIYHTINGRRTEKKRRNSDCVLVRSSAARMPARSSGLRARISNRLPPRSDPVAE